MTDERIKQHAELIKIIKDKIVECAVYICNCHLKNNLDTWHDQKRGYLTCLTDLLDYDQHDKVDREGREVLQVSEKELDDYIRNCGYQSGGEFYDLLREKVLSNENYCGFKIVVKR